MEPGVPARGEMSAVAADRFATAGDGGLQNFHFAGRAREEMVEHSPSTVIVAVVVDRRRWRAHGESVRRANGACPHTSHRPLRQSPAFRRKRGRGFSPVVNEEASLSHFARLSMRMHRSPRSLAYNLDILSQLPDGLFAAKPCGALTDYQLSLSSTRTGPYSPPESDSLSNARCIVS